MKNLYVFLFISVLCIKAHSQDTEIINMGKKTWPINQSNNFRSNNIGLDTLENLAYNNNETWYGGFAGRAGDAFLSLHRMPSDGTIKGVNVPVAYWLGNQDLTISIHRVSYPTRSDGESYPLSVHGGSGWTGGYDMDENGWMSFTGTNYSAGETQGICDPEDSVAYGAIDPLGNENGNGPSDVPMMGLVWPEGATTGTTTLDSANNPAGNDNWIDLTDAGSEVTVSEGEWIGVLVQLGEDVDQSSYNTYFYYRHASSPTSSEQPNHNLPPHWVFAKFYSGCGGSSGNGGWHIRNYMIKTQLAIERSGDDPPVVISMTEPLTLIDQDDRYFSAVVTDENFDDNTSGVASVSLNYYLNSTDNPSNQISMTQTAEANTWDCYIPGQPANTDIYWYLTATDVNGNTTVTDTNQYKILYSMFESPHPAYSYWTRYIQDDSTLYNFGGISRSSGSFLDSVFSYNFGTHTWSALSNMSSERYNVGLVHIDGKIYALSGNGTEDGTEYKVEQYDIEADNWTTLIESCPDCNNIDNPFGSGFRGDGQSKAGFVSCNGKIYTVSGHSNNPLSLYESEDGINWTTYNSSYNSSTYPYLLSVQDKVYIMNGIQGDDPYAFVVFNTSDGEFSMLEAPPITFNSDGRSNHLIYSNGNIFFMNDSNRELVQLYQIESNQWYQIDYSWDWFEYMYKMNNNYFLFRDDLSGSLFPLDSIAGIPFNVAPLKAELIYPTVQDTFSTHTDSDSLIVFRWHPSEDGDNDAVSYSLTIELEFFGNLYTDFYDDITDTTLGISSNSLDPILSATGQEEAMFSYFIVSSDGQESTMSDTGMFVLSRAALSTIENRLLPERFSLHQNYPNPFNPFTRLRYDLPEQAYVNITIYDMMGRQVKTLVSQRQDAGYKSVIWNAANDYGKPVSAGIYLYQIQAGEYISTKKMVLLK